MTMLRVQTDSAWTGFEDQNGKNFQRLTNDFLLWSNKRRPHWSLNGLTPHERFYGRRLAKTA
jgi:transposase InsO family protein